MRDHDLDSEHRDVRPAERPEHAQPPELDRALRAGRPEPLGPAGLLHLQRAAGNAGVQRLVGDAESDSEPSPVHRVVTGPGEALDPQVRGVMETRLGQDFGDVRVHHDADAHVSARSVQAHAYTVGNHVVFGEGRYRPDTDEGRHTLAHELTHVVQQRQGPVDGTPAPGGIRVSDPSDRFERDAEHTATEAMAAPGPVAPAVPAPAPAVQRTEDEHPAPEVVQRQAGEEEQEEEPAPAVQTEAAKEGEEEPTDEDVPVSRFAVQRQESEEEPEQES